MNILAFPLRIVAIFSLASALNAMPGPASAQSGPLLLTGFPLLRQQHALTCESAAASMGTRGQVSENQIMTVLPRDANPNLGFRGRPDGQQGTTLVDYGVYAAPVSQALLRFNYRSDVLLYSMDRVLRSYLDKGWPVVAWIPYALQPAKPRLSQHNGVQFFLVPHEHTVLLVRYDNLTVLVNDPWTGKLVRYFWRDFNRGWGSFGNMALAIEPCAMTKPVDPLQISNVTGTDATWSWNKPLNASSFDVTVTRRKKKDVMIDHHVQSALSITVSGLQAEASYRVAVRSLSACGNITAPVSLSVMISAVPTVIPTALITPSSTPQPTSAPTSTPTITVGPIETGTPKP